MAEITLTSEITATLVQQVGTDRTICEAAWQSTRMAPEDATEPRLFGLLRSLIRQRHGTPLEAGFLTVAVHAPLFVLAQHVRHRHQALNVEDLSFSVESARYREMEPVFWVPRRDRPMVPADGFKAMRPEFRQADDDAHEAALLMLRASYAQAWTSYRHLLGIKVAAEVARAVLPQATYCRWWASANLRSWLSFLSLRTKDSQAEVTSHVQQETEEVGRRIEAIISHHWPLTHRAWQETGRGAP